MGIIVAFKPEGIFVGGRLLDATSISGNLNVYKCVEGFMESIPQSVLQLSIMFRTPWDEISKYKSKNTYLFLTQNGQIILVLMNIV